ELTEEQRARRSLALAREQEKIVRLLTPAQRSRFQQIAIQFLGPQAFNDPDVAKALLLTVSQKKEIRALSKPVAMPGQKGPKGPGHRGPPGGRPDEARKCAQEQIDTVLTMVLTPEQRQKWDELVGPPFHGPLMPPDPMWFLPPAAPQRPPPGPGQHDRPRGKGPGPGRMPGGRGGP